MAGTLGAIRESRRHSNPALLSGSDPVPPPSVPPSSAAAPFSADGRPIPGARTAVLYPIGRSASPHYGLLNCCQRVSVNPLTEARCFLLGPNSVCLVGRHAPPPQPK